MLVNISIPYLNPERIHACLTCLLLSPGRPNNDKGSQQPRRVRCAASSSLETRVPRVTGYQTWTRSLLIISQTTKNFLVPLLSLPGESHVAVPSDIWLYKDPRLLHSYSTTMHLSCILVPLIPSHQRCQLASGGGWKCSPSTWDIHVCTCQDLSIWVIKKSVD